VAALIALKLFELCLFSSGDQTNCNNYIPISVLLQFKKLFEKMLNARVSAHLQE